jgi:endonuclease/exonuclease/phosphatase (EEP) superfamily protein YafD
MPDAPTAPPPAPTADAPKRAFRRGGAVVGVAATLPWSLAALAAWTDRPYALDLASHFVPQAAWATAATLGLLLLALRRWVGAASVLAAAAVAVLLWRGPARAPAGADGVPLRLVIYNAREGASTHDNDLIRWIVDQKPDIVVLIEAPWGLLADYPFLRREFPSIVEPQAGMMWNVVVLCRLPATFEGIGTVTDETRFSFAARRSLRVRVEGAGEVLLSAMHPPSPRTRESWAASLRGVEINGRLFREWRERTGLPVIVAGDFNSTPGGRSHRAFRASSGLTPWAPRLGGGTWPARLPAWLGIQIDQVWTSQDVRVESIRVGPRFRSDHRPVVADLRLGAASPG